ncbi:Cyclic AMP-dependent protein kinase [Phytophthora megakarya]|uniref:Cyclic AMP-dependent protein kinase n=1 Tax=Phytophthora megakarya TaxID=4795 RepID=A0A225V2Z9_9STRA|nr:Cyclic AMP-dependent protein kinase [Phytophthora megakarya]
MDGAPELNGHVIDALVDLLQTKKLMPGSFVGMVERFHCSWKGMMAVYVAEVQNDCDHWVHCAAYTYNGAWHSGTGFSPNELMMGRRQRNPKMLRESGVMQMGTFDDYHRDLGKATTKLTNQWVGPVRIVEDARFDNWGMVREDTGGNLVVHSSFFGHESLS